MSHCIPVRSHPATAISDGRGRATTIKAAFGSGNAGAILLGAVVQVAVVKVQFLQVAFRTASMDLAHWGAYAAEASAVLSYDEIRPLCAQGTRDTAHRADLSPRPCDVPTWRQRCGLDNVTNRVCG